MTDKPQLECSAFGCRRWTRRYPDGEIDNYVFLCPAHWPMVPRRLRRAMNKTFRRYERDPTNLTEFMRIQRLWPRCVESANRNLGMP